MGKSFDEILSIAGDIAGFIPGFQWVPAVTTAITAADEASRGDYLSAILNVVSAGVAHEAGSMASNAVTETAAKAAAKEAGSAAVKDAAGMAAEKAAGEAAIKGTENLAKLASNAAGTAASIGTQKVLEPGLANMLGMNKAPPLPNTIAPTKAPTSSNYTGSTGSSGLGAGGAPSNLDISGSSAPKIGPWAGSTAPTKSLGAADPNQMKGI